MTITFFIFIIIIIIIYFRSLRSQWVKMILNIRYAFQTKTSSEFDRP